MYPSVKSTGLIYPSGYHWTVFVYICVHYLHDMYIVQYIYVNVFVYLHTYLYVKFTAYGYSSTVYCVVLTAVSVFNYI